MTDAPAVGRRERKRRELHQRIFRTARGLFLEQGFDATTVAQIAEAADIAQATFFNHFPSKQAVLREMGSEVFERFRALLEEQRERSASTRERLRGFATRGAEIIERTPELTRDVLLEVLRNAAPPGQAGHHLEPVHRDFAALFRDGHQQGDVRADLDASFLAEIAVSAFDGTIVNWIENSHYPLQERMLQVAAFLGEAVLPLEVPPDLRGE